MGERADDDGDAEARRHHVDQVALANPVQLHARLDAPSGHPPHQVILDVRAEAARAQDEAFKAQIFEAHASCAGKRVRSRKHRDHALVAKVERSSRILTTGTGDERHVHPAWAGAVCTFLCSETVLPVACPAIFHGTPFESPAELGTLPLLHLTTRPKLWAEWFLAHESPVDEAYVGPRFDQFSMIVAAAIGGLGVALLPTYLIEEELRSGALIQLPDMSMSTDNSYYVVRPEKKQSHQTADHFQEWLKSKVDPLAVA